MYPEKYLEEAVGGMEVESVADIGTGHSGVFHYWWWMRKPVKLRVCVDIHLFRPDIPGWERVKADARHLPFRDRVFTVVQCCEMIEHVPPADHRRVLRELKRVAHGLVFLTASGASQHRPSPEELELERRNPYARYRGMVSRRLLEDEGFTILFHYKRGEGEHVKAVWKAP